MSAYSGTDAAALWSALIFVLVGILVVAYAQPTVRALVDSIPARLNRAPRYCGRHRAPVARRLVLARAVTA